MTDELLRQVLAAGLLRIEQRLERIETAIAERNFAPSESDDHATVEQELTSALRDYFGGGPFTSSTVLMAGEERGTLQEILAGVVDYNQTPHARAVQLGRLLARLPGLQRVGGRRGAVLWRVSAAGRGL